MSRNFTELETAIVVDVETTGLNPESDRVVSVAAIKVNFPASVEGNLDETDVLHFRCNPGIPMPAAAQRIHGITDEDLAGEPEFSSRAQELRDFIGSHHLVGHNVSFDKKFLTAEFLRAGVKALGRNRSYCTMQRIAWELGWRRISLDKALEQLGLPGRTGDRHGALEDAELALMLAWKLFNGWGQSQPPLPPRPQQSLQKPKDVSKPRATTDDLEIAETLPSHSMKPRKPLTAGWYFTVGLALLLIWLVW